MKRNRMILTACVLSLSLLFAGCQNTKTEPSQNVVAVEKSISYAGQDGKTVYDILKETHSVDASESSMGVLIKGIDGVNQTDTEFWLYEINGQQSNLGADKQETKSTDQITWELKGF